MTSTAAVTKTAVATATVTAKATAPVTPTVSARVTATAVSKAAAAPPLTAALLENATYLSANLPGGKATLKDGGFEQSTGPGATQKVVSRILGPIATGDLNGDGAADAVLILATNTGGTGTFVELHAVLNDGGKPQDAARADLGDRVFLKSLAIDPAGAIVVRMLTHGPKDPMCCPSEEVTQTYKLDGNALKLVSPAAKPGTTPSPATPPLTVDQLKNGTYLSEYVPAGKVTLKNGKFEQSTGAGATQKVVVVMIEPVAMGDLNGDKVSDAAVILATNTGGSGTFYDLHAVLNEGGKPVDVSYVLLGDRVQIKSLTITGRRDRSVHDHPWPEGSALLSHSARDAELQAAERQAAPGAGSQGADDHPGGRRSRIADDHDCDTDRRAGGQERRRSLRARSRSRRSRITSSIVSMRAAMGRSSAAAR